MGACWENFAPFQQGGKEHLWERQPHLLLHPALQMTLCMFHSLQLLPHLLKRYNKILPNKSDFFLLTCHTCSDHNGEKKKKIRVTDLQKNVAFHCKNSFSSKFRQLLPRQLHSFKTSYIGLLFKPSICRNFLSMKPPKRFVSNKCLMQRIYFGFFCFLFFRRTNQILGGLYCPDSKMS